MLGNLVILAVSYGILRYFGLGFAALGFDQPARRAAEFGAGFLVAGLDGSLNGRRAPPPRQQ